MPLRASRSPSRPSALPRVWLMTDERLSDALWPALARLPRGGGIVFRHYGLPPAQRRALFERVRRVARRRGLLLFLAGTAEQALAWRADGVHGRSRNGAGPRLLRTVPVHGARESARARLLDADGVMLSPVFPTRSHPGARSLGPAGFAALARLSAIPAIALGGMTPRRARRLARAGAHGWAAIDAWSNGKGPGEPGLRT